MKAQAQVDAFRQSLAKLKEALGLQKSAITRDSAILRFELAFETAWKACQTLARAQGFEVNSPKQAFEAAFRLGWITDEIIWDDILKKRNLAVHTYQESLAESLYGRLKDFLPAFEELDRSLARCS